MNIFITGATGVLGRPVVRLLSQSGHQVVALSRSAKNDQTIKVDGAQPVRASLYDPSSLASAIPGAAAILHLATRIPPSSEAGKPEAWQENDRIRSIGTHNLVNVALAENVRTFIYPGIVFFYPDRGAEWIDSRTAPLSSPRLQSSLDAESEVQRFTSAGGRGIILRMGGFYGPTAGHMRETIQWARRGIAMLFGNKDAYQPLIWVDDAASAVVAALEHAPAGIYDVVDDEPLTRAELISSIAPLVGKRHLIKPPALLMRLLAGKDAMFLARSQRVSNRRFNEATGWQPSVPNARVGLRRLASEIPLPEDHQVRAKASA